MKLFTTENNTAALKILLAAKYGQSSVDIEFASVEDSRFKAPHTLPVLEFESGNILFLSNPSARYLFPPKQEIEIATDQWLEWEATILQPLVVSYLSNPAKPDPILRSRLVEELITIEAALATKKFLTEDSVSVADLSVWSCLYPIGTDPKFSEVLFSTSKQAKSWFLNLAAEPMVKEAAATLKLKPGAASYQTPAATARLPNFSVSQQKPRPPLQAAISLESPVKEAPVLEAELKAAAEAWLNGAARRARPKPSASPVLPQEGARNVLITSALPYVNNVPHLGNIIGCVLSADVFARFSRLRGHTTLYICGTDEYGTATETKALEEGLTSQEICDKYFKIHEAIYRWFDISFDYFGRTTTPEQTEICQEMFLQLHKNGYMCMESMEQLLCLNCNRYLADRFVEGTCPRCSYEDARGDQCDGCGHLINATELLKPRCKICQQAPVIRNSEQYFLDLPKLEPTLKTWVEGSSPGWSHNARIITRSWLRDGLRPRCITRDLNWGIPVPLPGFRDKVFYVWFDAPFGYMSMTKCYTAAWERWWRPSKAAPVTLYQFMAKDNVPFHSVMFPAALLGTGLDYVTVSHIMATEYLNYEDGKFSKSRGVGVFGTDARDTGIPQDVWRFYLLYVRPEGQDSSFSWADLATKNNSELLNNLGNFVNRALVFADKNFGGRVPEMNPEGPDLTLLALVGRELRAYVAAVGKAKLRDGIRHILAIGRHGNQYMQAQQPWVLLKGSDLDRTRAGTVIGLCCNLACLLSVLLHPYMPGTSATLRGQLAAPEGTLLIGEEVSVLLPAGHQLGTPAPLFNKIEPDHVEKLKQKFAGQQKAASPEAKQSALVQGGTVASLEAAVAEQGELVRKVKASGVAKSECQPHIAKLLELKRQLTEAQDAAKSSQGKENGLTKGGTVACLETAVAEQGELVRKVKASGVAKSEWQPHVAKLLDLKHQLAEAQAGADSRKVVENGLAQDETVASLETAVAEQGALVRKIKASGVAKSEWQPHIAKLLDLKRQLTEAQAANKK